jgi:hypothetical protein
MAAMFASISKWCALAMASLILAYAIAWTAYRSIKLGALRPVDLPATASWQGPETASCRALYIGDSRVAHWPLTSPSGWRLGKLGYPGQTTANILRAGLGEVHRSRPHAVILLLGGNDAVAASFLGEERRQAQVRATLAAVDAFVSQVRRGGAQAVVILKIVPSIEPPLWKRVLLGSAPAEVIQSMNAGLEALAKQQGAQVLHPGDMLLTDRGTLRPGYRRDDSHWTPAAYRALDSQVLEALPSAQAD